MDEQNLNVTQQPVEQPAQSMPVETPVQPVMQSTSPVEYASFMSRMIAFVIDQVLIVFVVGLLSTAVGLIGMSTKSAGEPASIMINLISFLAQMVYYVSLTTYKGATLGKMAVGIRVQHASDGQNLTLVETFLREVVGKFLSGMVLGLGYLWMLWDPNKQTWHDKIAKSVVVKAK